MNIGCRNVICFLFLFCLLGGAAVFLPPSEAMDLTGEGEIDIESTVNDEELSLSNKKEGTPYDAAGMLTYRTENGAVTIMSCSDRIAGTVYIPDSIDGKPVTAIDAYAFLYCTSLESVVIPAGVTSVGDYAFAYCTGLKSVTVQSGSVTVGKKSFYRDYALQSFGWQSVRSTGMAAFAYCTALTGTVNFSDELTSLGEYTFLACETLSAVMLPSGLSQNEVGFGAFYNCTSLKSAPLPEAWTVVPGGIFYGCPSVSVSLPRGVTEIKEYAYGGNNAEQISLPESVTRIGAYAFYKCKNLAQIDIPDGVTEIGSHAFAQSTSLRISKLPEALETIGEKAFYFTLAVDPVFGERLKTIGEAAFGFCYEIRSVEIPSGLETLGDDAFNNCRALTSVVFSEGSTDEGIGSAFTQCYALESVTLPSTWTNVPDGIFQNCTALKDVTFSAGISAVGADAFHNCTSLEEISIPSSVKTIGTRAFEDCTALSAVRGADGLTEIGGSAFESCTALSDITLASSLQSIGSSAFSGTGLKSVIIPSGVTSMGIRAFSTCQSLKSVTVQEGVTSISSYAFVACKSLVNLVLPDSLTAIGAYAFQFDSSLTEVTIPAGTAIGESAFASCTSLKKAVIKDGSSIGKKTFSGCTSLAEVQLPADVTAIGDGAFQNCTSLKNINLPEGLTEIGADAFLSCSSLENISLPSSLTSLGGQAFASTGIRTLQFAEGMKELTISVTKYSNGPFYDCKNLDSVTIPSGWEMIPDNLMRGCSGSFTINMPPSVTVIGSYAFYNCSGLSKIDLSRITCIGDYAFYGCGFTSFSIPDGVAPEDLGVQAIAAMPYLTDIVLPETWDTIPENLFQNNQAMKSYIVPDHIKSIGAHAFDGASIETITLPEGLTVIGEGAFQNAASLKEIFLPSSLTKISKSAFAGTTSLTAISFPSSLTEMEENAFDGSGLVSVTIPGNITVVPAYAFADCDHLKTVTVNPGVTTIQGIAFGYCDTLEQVTIPDSVTQIATTAFYASNMGSVYIDAAQTSTAEKYVQSLLYLNSAYTQSLAGAAFGYVEREKLGFYDFDYYVTYGDLKYNVVTNGTTNEMRSYGSWKYNYVMDYYAEVSGHSDGITAVSIPSYLGRVPVTGISGSAFLGCTTLREVSTGSRVTTLGTSAFSGCTALQSVDLSASAISSIGMRSFYNCSSLASVKFPASLEKIQMSAFQYTGLTGLNFAGTSVNYIAEAAFKGCADLAEVKFQEGLVQIDSKAFADTALTDVYLPSSLKLLQYDSFDGDVRLHFTGDATNTAYYWVDQDENVHYSYVLYELLENRGNVIAQFRGGGLENPSDYFVSSEKAGLDTAVAAGVPVETASISPEASGEIEQAADAVAAPLGDVTGKAMETEGSSGEEEESGENTVQSIYEVIRDAAAENPMFVFVLILLSVILISIGGYSRYRKNRRA